MPNSHHHPNSPYHLTAQTPIKQSHIPPPILKPILTLAGTIHLAISNRYFATKAISLWLHQSESTRLELIANFLHFWGFEGIEVVEVVRGGEVGRWEGEWGSRDPVWVVRGRKGRV